MIQPWILALGVLVVVCAIGVYTIGSVNLGLEGFFTYDPKAASIRRAAQAKCEAKYQVCINYGKDNETCTKEADACNAAAVAGNTNISVATNVKSNSNSFGTSAIAALDSIKGTDSSGNPVDYQSLRDTIDRNNFLKKIQEQVRRIPQRTYIDDRNDINTSHSPYIPRTERIYAHQTPRDTPAPLTARQDPQASEITNGSYDLASLRSMIRKDVKKAVHEEMEKINNEYEIVYE
jgi:hypothetical protein